VRALACAIEHRDRYRDQLPASVLAHGPRIGGWEDAAVDTRGTASAMVAAVRGRRLWVTLRRRYRIDDGLYVVVMPDSDEELNGLALQHVPDLIADRRGRGVVVVTSDPPTAQRALSVDGVVGVEEVSAAGLDRLVSLVELYRFSDRLLVVSLTRPWPRKLHAMVGVDGLTLEDVVCLGMLVMRSWSDAAATPGNT
jgi:hypothetical protein